MNENINRTISIKEILLAIWDQKYSVIALTTIFAVGSVMYSLSLPNIYKSEVLLAPVDQQESLSSLSQNFSGLASLAGVNISNSSSSRSNEGIEILQSFNLFQELLDSNDVLPDLIAIKSWNSSDNEIKYDPNLYDYEKKEWVRSVEFPLKTVPSDQEAFRYFKEIFVVNKDPKTGFIRASIEHQSPYISKIWLKSMIELLNENFRKRDKQSALKSIEFLNLRIASTNLSEIKLALSELIQNQTQTLMLIESNEEYIFKVLDPAFVPEKKLKPNRAIICVSGTVIGFIISVLLILIRVSTRKI